MKANKLEAIKRTRLKKGTMIEEKNIEVVDVREGDNEVDPNVATITERRKEVEDEGRTRFYPTKSRSLTSMR